MKTFVPALFLLSMLALFSGIAHAQGPILILRIEGVINPVIGDYVKDGVKAAEERKAAALLIELDTPGGLLDATRSAISAMINSDIPIMVYVAPRGARATSAGVFITMASDLAAMAPETHIGAAHPVTLTGESPQDKDPFNQKDPENSKNILKKLAEEKKNKPSSVLEEKMVSDSAAYIRALATERGRNADWAERAVRESVSLTAEEAQRQGVIEVIAHSREELIQKIDGREIKKDGKSIKLDLKGSAMEQFPMTFVQSILHKLAHPNVAYILMMLGIYGLIYEFAHPGNGIGGIVGGISLLLAFYSLQVLPVNTVGLVLILLGVGCFIVELLTFSHGLLLIGGVISFGIGSFMLINVPRDLSVPRVSMELILPTILMTVFLFGFVFKKIISARRARPRTGSETLIGAIGEVKEPCAPNGLVFINGELWGAESSDHLAIGDKVIVTGQKGNKLSVKKN